MAISKADKAELRKMFRALVNQELVRALDVMAAEVHKIVSARSESLIRVIGTQSGAYENFTTELERVNSQMRGFDAHLIKVGQRIESLMEGSTAATANAMVAFANAKASKRK